LKRIKTLGRAVLCACMLVSGIATAETGRTQAVVQGSLDDVSVECDEQLSILKRALFGKQVSDTQKAAQTLGALRKQLDEATWSLTGLLGWDPQPAVRIAAIDALLNCDDLRMFGPFFGALSDREPRVQCRALIGLYNVIPHYGPPDSKLECPSRTTCGHGMRKKFSR
jgi:hypothetical protein